jgi:2'-5' RNA ligase
VTRAFVSVRPPDAVLDAVGAIELDCADARLTTRGQWHVTLQFLGNRADIDAVAAALQGLQEPAATAQLAGLGAFPNARRARVLWVGIADGADTFAALAAEVGARLAPLGHEPEARAFHAHLTLARFKTPVDASAILAAGLDAVGPPWLVDEVTVFESRLRRSGAQYVPRSAIRLPPAG